MGHTNKKNLPGFSTLVPKALFGNLAIALVYCIILHFILRRSYQTGVW